LEDFSLPTPLVSPTGLTEPIVLAPLAGGPSTPALAAAVSDAGGLGFLAAGYVAPGAVSEAIAGVRGRTDRAFGVNLFAPPEPTADPAAVQRYAATLQSEARRAGAPLGEPAHDDDGWEGKLAVVERERVAVVSFTFGCPSGALITRLQESGCAVWVTVTTPQEAALAMQAGADALVVQGVEAGGHRGSFRDDAPGEFGLLALLQLVGASVDLPMVATGGIVTGRGIAAALACGAAAAQLGTAFLLTPEAGTSDPHRTALGGPAATALTRAFSGRLGRGVVNRFMREHSDGAPSAYPDVHHLTTPLRRAARERGDAEAINLWAGQAHALAASEPAGDLVRRLGAEAREALREAVARTGADRP
jgi:nitronate monooxygenase